MSTCKTMISAIVQFRLKEQMMDSNQDVCELLNTNLPFSYGKLILNSPFKKKCLDTNKLKSTHRLEYYFDIPNLLKKHLAIFYQYPIKIELEFDVTIDPQNENQLALLTLFNTMHHSYSPYSFEEDYVFNVLNLTSQDMYDEICKMIFSKLFEATVNR